MNAVFTIADPALEAQFLKKCKDEGMIGVKGHRNVGGFRVSLYNALPISSVKAITDLMNDFAKQYGS
jgi:phosphoserine aminotransferase